MLRQQRLLEMKGQNGVRQLMTQLTVHPVVGSGKNWINLNKRKWVQFTLSTLQLAETDLHGVPDR